MYETSKMIAEQLGMPIWIFIVIFIWSYIWKFLALWKSARKNSKIWFFALFIVNTIGILEILYIFVFSKMKLSTTKKPAKKSSKKTKKRR